MNADRLREMQRRLNYWWHNGTHATYEALDLAAAIGRHLGDTHVYEEEEVLNVFPVDLLAEVEELHSSSDPNLRYLSQELAQEVDRAEEFNPCYEILSLQTGNVIGWCHGRRGMESAMNKELPVTFRIVVPRDCGMCAEPCDSITVKMIGDLT